MFTLQIRPVQQSLTTDYITRLDFTQILQKHQASGVNLLFMDPNLESQIS